VGGYIARSRETGSHRAVDLGAKGFLIIARSGQAQRLGGGIPVAPLRLPVGGDDDALAHPDPNDVAEAGRMRIGRDEVESARQQVFVGLVGNFRQGMQASRHRREGEQPGTPEVA
jgi:hypothetical protein